MFRKKLIGVLAAAFAIAAITAAIAQGTGTSQSSGTKSKGTARAAEASGSPGPRGSWMGGPGHRIDGPGGDAVHSESVVPDKAGTGFVTVTSDSGTVKSVDGGAGSITLVEGTRSATYKTVTLSIPSGATVVRDGKKASLGELKAEDHVSVSSSSEGTTVFAMDSSFRPGRGFDRGGHPGMPGPPPGQEGSGAEANRGLGSY